MQGVVRSTLVVRASPPAEEAGDADLVALAQASPHAFEMLYRRYVDAVHRFCYRRLGTREAAEDVTSIIFTKAFASLPAYRSGSFRSWLFTIAYHVVADDLRARRPVVVLDEEIEIVERDPSPEDVALSSDAHRTVVKLLAQLPEGQRRIVELRLAGLSSREIATVLGRGLPAVKMAQLRGYARLRELLAVERDEEVRDGQR